MCHWTCSFPFSESTTVAQQHGITRSAAPLQESLISLFTQLIKCHNQILYITLSCLHIADIHCWSLLSTLATPYMANTANKYIHSDNRKPTDDTWTVNTGPADSWAKTAAGGRGLPNHCTVSLGLRFSVLRLNTLPHLQGQAVQRAI
jgi:hypothetical protein